MKVNLALDDMGKCFTWVHKNWKHNRKQTRCDKNVNIFKGLRPVLEGFVDTMHEGPCETGSQIPRALARGIWRTVRTSPSALWQQTPPEPVLITIITWHFQFRPVNVSILHLKYDYRARSKTRFTLYSHCYVTWCPLVTWSTMPCEKHGPRDSVDKNRGRRPRFLS